MKIQYGVDRYKNETRRLYRTMNTQLQKTPFLVGDKCTIADIASWGWVAAGGKRILFRVQSKYPDSILPDANVFTV